LTKIELRIREFDSSEEVKPAPNEERLCGSNQHSSVDQCLPRIVAEMVNVRSSFSSTRFYITSLLLILFRVVFGGVDGFVDYQERVCSTRGCQCSCLNFTVCAHNGMNVEVGFP